MQGVAVETYVDLRTQRRITTLCCVLYLALGIARYNYSACLLAIVEAEAFSRATAGFIGTLSFFAFALGTALGGFVADRASSRRLILWAMLASGACNLVFYVTDSYPVMLVVWTLNGLAQGPIFSSVLHLLSDFYPRERVTGASVTVQCAFFVGVGAAYAVSALAIRFFTWREAFLAAALACALFSLVWNPVLKRAERQLPAAEEAGPARAAEAAKAQPAAGRTPGAWTLLRCAGLAFLPVPLLVQGILRDGITAWGPSYVGELFGLDESLAVASSMVIPLISILGIFASTYVRAWQRGNELRAAAAFFLFSTGLLAALVLTEGWSLALSLLLLAGATACMSATNAMLINAVPLQFGADGKSGALSAVLNTAVYLGSGLSMCGIGLYVTAFGWRATSLGWTLLCAAAATVCCLAVRPWTRYKERRGWR